MFRLNFTMQVLGAEAAERLRRREVTQTLRSPSANIVREFLNGRLKIGDLMEVALDGEVLGLAYPAIIDRVTWVTVAPTDAVRGGLNTLDELQQTLQRAGYRFQPMEKYAFYRVQFTWLPKDDKEEGH